MLELGTVFFFHNANSTIVVLLNKSIALCIFNPFSVVLDYLFYKVSVTFVTVYNLTLHYP